MRGKGGGGGGVARCLRSVTFRSNFPSVLGLGWPFSLDRKREGVECDGPLLQIDMISILTFGVFAQHLSSLLLSCLWLLQPHIFLTPTHADRLCISASETTPARHRVNSRLSRTCMRLVAF